MLAIELGHAFGVVKDQRYEYVNRTLLREPKAEFVTTERDGVQRLNQNDPETKGHDKPDRQAKKDDS
jgi:hypothetical protein